MYFELCLRGCSGLRRRDPGSGLEGVVVRHGGDQAVTGRVPGIARHQLLVVTREIDVEWRARVGVLDEEIRRRHRELAESQRSASEVQIVGDAAVRAG